MKTSTVGIVGVAILLVVAGVGIAQAGGTQTIEEYTEWQASRAANSPVDEMQPVSGGQEFVPEGNWSGTDWQTRGPVETGAIPETVLEEPWMKDYAND
jgi:hypothetical protein